MSECFVGIQTDGWILLEKLGNEVFGLFRYSSPVFEWKVDVCVSYLPEDDLLSLIVKWRVPTQEQVGDDTHTPYVTVEGVLSIEHLWSHVVRRTNSSLEVTVKVLELGKTEVNQLDLSVLVLVLEQEVLRLYISMHDAEIV